jgi:hypothetical protein
MSFSISFLSVAISCTISSLSLARSLKPEKRKEF